eukprot:GGOE01001517.1.p1 GENE.GGOE01001517.1~~GGOE01001517.1.p1  ORF type:complete len:778 (+),score=182.67 GGOE01001517.1:100-2433(+)
MEADQPEAVDFTLESWDFAEDEVAAERVLRSHDTSVQLQDLWLCALQGGEAFFLGLMSSDMFAGLTEAMGLHRLGPIAEQDRRAFRQRFQAIAQAGRVDFNRFVRILFHVAMYRHETPERVPALRVLLSQFGRPYVQRIQLENMHDGCNMSPQLEAILQPHGFSMVPLLDRLLFRYDAVFRQLFLRYKGKYDHQVKKATLPPEVLQSMDETIEVEDMRLLLHDFTLFPSEIKTLDICRLMSFAVFGEEPAFSDEGHVRLESPTSAGPDVSLKTELRRSTSTTAPVYFQDAAVTPRLDRKQFVDALFRVSQFLYHHEREYPTISSRLEKLLRDMEPIYATLFDEPMADVLLQNEPGVPSVSAIDPSVLKGSGPFAVEVTGCQFCPIRDVFVRLSGQSDSTIVKAEYISDTCMRATILPIPAVETRVDVAQEDGVFAVEVARVISLAVTASNDRVHFGGEEPPLTITMEEEATTFVLPDELASRLSAFFLDLDSQKNRTSRLPTERKLREALQRHQFEVPEAVERDMEGHLQETEAVGPRLEMFLGKFIQSLLTRGQWAPTEVVERLVRMMEKQGTPGTSPGGPTITDEELHAARAAIKLLQRGTFRSLDIYCGPVLCGTVQERPGLITAHAPVQSRPKHKFLTYVQHDANTEAQILSHISMADTFDHLLNRLLRAGFELAASCNPSTRKPIGRCWTIHTPSEKIGALWDYAGQMSNLDWQPAEIESLNEAITMTIYRPEDDVHFVLGFLCYYKAKDVNQLRTNLQGRGYQIQTELYKW